MRTLAETFGKMPLALAVITVLVIWQAAAVAQEEGVNEPSVPEPVFEEADAGESIEEVVATGRFISSSQQLVNERTNDAFSTDLLGTNTGHVPRHAKQYADLNAEMERIQQMRVDAFARYVDVGEGDPIVLLHGNPTWSFFFRRVISTLSPGYRCIAPDHMGCGLSDKPDGTRYDFRLHSRVADFSALMDHLALERVTLMVHDWGGMIAMAWAVDHPQRVSASSSPTRPAFFRRAANEFPCACGSFAT